MKVAVLAGGKSGEHDISLVTAEAVRGALETLGHEVLDWRLGRDGGASWQGGAGSVADGLLALKRWAPDVAFIAMHGEDGEDGVIQGALELLEIPYQGSQVTASALAMDKVQAKAIYREAGLPVADDCVLRGDPASVDWGSLELLLGLPVVLKTAESGSSVGVELVETVDALKSCASEWLSQGSTVLVESFLGGRELTCAVLETLDGDVEALPLVEIVVKEARFFDYDTKYDPDAVDEICPAPVDGELADRVVALGLAAHEVLGCRHYSRTDVMLDDDGEPVILETNTLPGLTPASLLPKSAEASGLSFPRLIQRLLDLATAHR